MANPFDLTGKVALVTGANTGLGQGMAVALAEAGADVCLVGRSQPDETVAKVAALGRKAHVILADLGSADGVGAIVAVLSGRHKGAVLYGIEKRCGRPDQDPGQ